MSDIKVSNISQFGSMVNHLSAETCSTSLRCIVISLSAQFGSMVQCETCSTGEIFHFLFSFFSMARVGSLALVDNHPRRRKTPNNKPTVVVNTRMTSGGIVTVSRSG